MGVVDRAGEGMALRPGDRRIVSVSPRPRQGTRTWTCARCGTPFAVGDSWEVTYRHHDGDEYRFVVCADCAHDLSPVRVTLDLGKLEGERDLELAPLVSVARFVVSSREDEAPADDRLQLRYADIHLLAELFGLSPIELEDQLRERGIAEV
jgi:hypothetical protein